MTLHELFEKQSIQGLGQYSSVHTHPSTAGACCIIVIRASALQVMAA